MSVKIKNSPFQLKAPFPPAGDQPKAIEELSKILSTGEKAVLLGVTGSGKTMTMAGVIENLGKPTLIITHNKTLAAQLYREMKDFFPENAVEYFISYYDYYQPEAYMPVTDTYIEKDASINDEIEVLRLRATSSLLERDDVIVVASVSCIYGLGSPEDYEESVLVLKPSQEISRRYVTEKLLHMQYERNDTELLPGRFRLRGDVVEIFPAYSNELIRIEFFGDEVEALKRTDPLTGKSREVLKRVAIYPAKHFITSKPRLAEAIEAIREELKERVKFFERNNKPLEAERIQQRTLYDIEMLKEMGYCSGIENYSRHLTGRPPGSRPACLLDYFPEDFLIIIDESHVTIPQIAGMYNGDRARKQTLVDFGFRLPSALDNRPLNFEEFEQLAKNVLYVSATPAEYELKQTKHVVEQIIRPTGLLDPIVHVRPTEGQMEHLLQEIQKRTKQKERTLVTTLTKKMAEALTEYLVEHNIKARYMHSDIDALERVEILRDLRAGVFDVLVGINLLREGLDLPEVSLVAILDADKEGFLRSRRSLIQTMGRAARNVHGTVILYADTITDSMKAAIEETARRRKIQEEYNQKHGITPQTIQKKVVDIIEREKKEEEKIIQIPEEFAKEKFSSEKQWKEAIKQEMLKAAENLDFERAALLRDILFS
ncbi:MAG: excinuclease ABC subunit UvrB [Candidatus Hydrogenedentota bacterium]|nr:MAG: excinuclease ABC subunit UvrB [Candidatus Hydrogenedentota bacterium]